MWEGLFHVRYIGDTIVRIALRSILHFGPVSYTHLTLPTTPYV